MIAALRSRLYKTASLPFSSSPFFTLAASSPLHQPHGSMGSARDFVEDTINNNKVVIFSKSYCPYCAETKQLFRSKFPNIPVKVIELDGRPDMTAIQDYIKEKTDKRTVPQTFISRQRLGGNDDLYAAYEAGEVQRLLDQSA
ncbi:thioredoxin-like protein [Pisolithus croceorrhizus]|nr:thioredoxin-like protein [Pisolithus croceorrhizus]KAI6161365.1 thioredoxin-like protein [Pisolithus thermaeus]